MVSVNPSAWPSTQSDITRRAHCLRHNNSSQSKDMAVHIICMYACMGARRNFSRGGGAKLRGLTKMTYFSARPTRERKFLRFFRHFRLNLRIFDASAEGTEGMFSTGTAYDVIIFKIQGGAAAPGCPPPPGVYVCMHTCFMRNNFAAIMSCLKRHAQAADVLRYDRPLYTDQSHTCT